MKLKQNPTFNEKQREKREKQFLRRKGKRKMVKETKGTLEIEKQDRMRIVQYTWRQHFENHSKRFQVRF